MNFYRQNLIFECRMKNKFSIEIYLVIVRRPRCAFYLLFKGHSTI